VSKDLQETKQSIQLLKTELDGRKSLENEMRASTLNIERVIAGGSSRGLAGESILAEALKQFPPDVIETNFKIKGCIVEYAMILSDGKRVPIDSKWTKPELIESLDKETDPVKKEELVEQIEKTLKEKVKEVTKYIDPSMTVSWGIAAIPLAVYNVCKRAHLDAFRQNVIIMPYSLAVIYLLSLYHLHRQYCSSVDIVKIESYISQIERGLETINKELENSVARGSTMITNAYSRCIQIIGELRNATYYLRTVSPSDEPKSLGSSKENTSIE
jgi:DNA recombination protein RmuC